MSGKKFGLAFAVMFVVAALISGWFAAQGKITEAKARFIEREAAQGRQWLCENETRGGLPIGVSRSCTGLTFSSAGTRASFAGSTGGWSLAHPDSGVVDLVAPMEVQAADMKISGQWTAAQARYGGAVSRSADFSAIVKNGRFNFAGPFGAGTSTFDRLSFSIAPGNLHSHDANVPFEWLLDGLSGDNLAKILGPDETIHTRFAGEIDHIDQSPNQPLPQALESWRAKGGMLKLAAIDIAVGAMKLTGSGAFSIDAGHYPAGDLNVTLIGFDGWMQKHGFASGNMAAALVSGMLKPMEDPNDKNIKHISLKLENGRLMLGKMALPVPLKPLY